MFDLTVSTSAPADAMAILAPDGVRGEIADHGNPSTAPRIHDRPGAHGGYGLRLVDALTTAWGVREGTTDVWFKLGG